MTQEEKEQKKAEKAALKKKMKSKNEGIWSDFKKFISRGNIFDMAVGVVIGGAFNAIVTALVNILLSVATWGVPGGIKGLVTVLPAAPGNTAQAGAAFADSVGGVAKNAQKFSTAEVNDMVIKFAAAQGKTITVEDTDFTQWKNSLLGLYDLHGTTFTYKMSAVIDWGSFINAIISFFIIAITLFIIVKVVQAARAKRAAMEAEAQEKYYQKHPEERPAPVQPDKPKPTQEELLASILLELKKSNGETPTAKGETAK
jgi:large-conductance mechanosensitive channel